MGPVPEPAPPAGLSDEDRPQQPPIFLSSSDEEDDLPQSDPGFPPGYMPIAHSIEVQWDSDSECDAPESDTSLFTNEEEQSTTSNISQSSSHVPETEQPEDGVDYTSVASLMRSLEVAGGPTVVTGSCGLEGAYADDDSDSEECDGATTRATAAAAANTSQSSLASVRIRAVPSPHDTDPSESESSVFNSTPLAPEQQDAVMRAMQGFNLPASSIPSWATNVQDTDLSTIIKTKTDTCT